jgi:hypothetical protein
MPDNDIIKLFETASQHALRAMVHPSTLMDRSRLFIGADGRQHWLATEASCYMSKQQIKLRAG